MSADWIRSRLRLGAQAPATPFDPEVIASRAKVVRRRRMGATTAVAAAAVVAMSIAFVEASSRREVFLGRPAIVTPSPSVGPPATPVATASIAPSEPPAATASAAPTSSPPTDTSGPVCRADHEAPADARGATTRADLDGDGHTDEILFDVPQDASLPVTMYARFDAGGAASLVLDDAVPSGSWIDVATALDLNGDGTEEAIVFLGGNTALLYAVVTLQDCELVRVLHRDGTPVTLMSGSSLVRSSGVHCDGEYVAVRDFEHAGDGPAALTERRYVLEAATLHFVDERRTEAEAPPPDVATVCGA